ncbi:hypothetical protein [Coleofasciculus sp. E2-BRE-01]|uniref:hypothetical protein n=1 Tax=Coleofasciculus sp. E2-BRE-01 TaxID=3069524 RepID=UPI00406365B2
MGEGSKRGARGEQEGAEGAGEDGEDGEDGEVNSKLYLTYLLPIAYCLLPIPSPHHKTYSAALNYSIGEVNL